MDEDMGFDGVFVKMTNINLVYPTNEKKKTKKSSCQMFKMTAIIGQVVAQPVHKLRQDFIFPQNFLNFQY